jgi:hypothetical protein
VRRAAAIFRAKEGLTMKHAVAAALLALALMPAGLPASAGERAPAKCYDCVTPRKHYDSREVVKTHRNVDHSRVINTTSVVHLPPRVVVRVPVVTVVKVVVQHYRVVEQDNYALVDVGHRPVKDCWRGRRGTYSGSCGQVLRVRG